jgi:DNA (cytosine-5)-methyltransferase 1
MATILKEASLAYKKQYKKLEGRPDFALLDDKMVIFCDSEFWHGHKWGNARKKELKTRKKFWINKIESNIKRDKIVNKTLKKKGWKVLRFWGKDILKNSDKCLNRITGGIDKGNTEGKVKYSVLMRDITAKHKGVSEEADAYITHYLHNKDSEAGSVYKRKISGILPKNFFKTDIFWDIPFPPVKNPAFTFIDLFAGIGGFRIALQNLGGSCVFSCEIDKYAKKTYETNFGEMPFGDIKNFTDPDLISDKELNRSIPDHDVLAAGFPCQAFSIAGKRGGFDDTRGTLFFDIARIIKVKQPRALLLENVKGLMNHRNGKTLATILNVLRNDLGYFVPDPKVLNAKNFGLPQNRERIIIAGFHPDTKINNMTYPDCRKNGKYFSDIKEIEPVSAKYYLSEGYLESLRKHRERHESKGNGFGYEIIRDDSIANAIVVGGMGRERNLVIDRRLRNFTPITKIKGKINREGVRRMTEREWARLQGFPDRFKIVVSTAQAYKQFGNSVPIPLVQAVGENVIKNITRRAL